MKSCEELFNNVCFTPSCQVYYRKKRRSREGRQGASVIAGQQQQQQLQSRRHSQYLLDDGAIGEDITLSQLLQSQPVPPSSDLLCTNVPSMLDAASGSMLPQSYYQLNYHRPSATAGPSDSVQQQHHHHQHPLTVDQVVQMHALSSKLGDMSTFSSFILFYLELLVIWSWTNPLVKFSDLPPISRTFGFTVKPKLRVYLLH